MIHPDDLIGALGVSLFDAPISADQYDGLSALIDLWNSTSLTDPRWLAYILATVHHETGKRFMPVRETFAPDDATARRRVATMDYGHEENGHVYYGRGFVQITWLDNYKRIGTRLGIDLAGNPDLALDLDFSARIAVIGMSAVQFQRQLGLTRYETAFGILHKLRAGMVRPDQDRIGGHPDQHVEVDETWVGGRTRGEGRGIHHKTLVSAAVEVRHREPGTAQDKRKDGRYAGRVRLAIAADRSADSLGGFVESAVLPGSLIVTDDWSGYGSLRKLGYDHHAIAECGDPEVAEEFMPIIHLVFSNLKTWLNGIHHGVSAKHLQAYLNEFTFRFNRRFYPFNAFRSLLGIAGGTASPTYAELYSGEWRHPTCCGHGR
jgi:hypothetical protein